MVEFLLIFALGFLAAALIGMLITPAIYGRIVKLTEKRIEATVPLSAAEIKGKSDLMRAGFASETAKLTTELQKEREKIAEREWAANKLQGDLASLAGDKTEADQKIAELETQSADLRSEARKQQQLIDKLSSNVTDFERMKRADTQEINRLNNDLMAISTEVESMKIDLATSGTETVSLRSEINSLEDQRQQLQSDIKAIADTAHDLQEEHQLEQERHNNSRIELAATQSTLADAEMQLGRAHEEIEALQQVNQELQDEAKAIADTAHELQQSYGLEQQAHGDTRLELAKEQAALAEHQAMLEQSTEEIDTQLQQLQTLTETERQSAQALQKAEQQIAALTSKLENKQVKLQEIRASAADTKEALNIEVKNHKAARSELAAKQTTLTELQNAHERSTEQTEAQLKQLRTLTESERQSTQALKKAEQKIETLTNKLQNTQAQLHKNSGSVSEIKEALSLEQKNHKSARAELAAKQSALAEHQAALERSTEKDAQQSRQLHSLTQAERQGAQVLENAQQQVQVLTTKLQNTQAALEKSQNAAAELKDRISGLNASEKRRLKDAAIAADRLKDLEVSLPDEASNTQRRPAELDGKSPGSNGDRNPQQSTEQPGTELETQVGALKDALKKSKETSGEFRQQLNKMRQDVHQLNPSGTANGNDRSEVETETHADHPKSESDDTGGGIGRAMQSDPALKTRVEELRARQQVLIADLKSGNQDDDDRLREEIADIAALVVGLSAHRDGRLSPVRTMISETNSAVSKSSNRKSLAERARAQLEN